ncbi:MAG: helix-turn-helix transcriptional regulator [Gemmatimonadaceae bacterium]|nr:helix-turn-helix transcriptional regulator [Gemmatimonadaceae bacterium]
MWHDKGGCGSHGAGRRGWGFGDDFSAMFWGGGGRRRGGPFRGGRMFEQGDLKYVILQLLAEKPRHGYEIIKELEDRCAGSYAPSAGTVYPTLALLEDLGYASVALEEGGKKVYSITDEGRAYLVQNQSAVDDIFERIAEFGASFLSDGMREINRAMGSVGKSTYANAASYFRDKEKVARVREVLERSAKEIDEILGRTPV